MTDWRKQQLRRKWTVREKEWKTGDQRFAIEAGHYSVGGICADFTKAEAELICKAVSAYRGRRRRAK